jgi:hypothetical protein
MANSTEETFQNPKDRRDPGDGGRGACFYLAVGITNSAPLPMLSGQRCITDFCLV